jgi:hypothetical protein
MARRLNIIGLVIGTALLLLASPVRADTLEKLVMPGPVTAAHQKVENECAKCHAPFNKGDQKSLCIACHDKVGADIKAGRGFHGRDSAARSRECRTCHSDHKGRAFDIVGLNKEAFDHGSTNFKLSGAHATAVCAACHAPGRKFRDAPGRCVDCHENRDVHKGNLGKDCISCHTPEAWRKAAFDHAKTKFPLTGAHAKVQCSACHPSARYKETPLACISCHGLSDVHQGVFGGNCDQCHSAASWKTAKFDHAKTDFPLRGRHGALACALCHTPAMKSAKLASGCVDCHKADDVHKGTNGTVCRDCHGEVSWKTVSFNHDKDTKFPLRGGHKKAVCTDCHKQGPKKVRLQATCASCHGDADPHKGQLGTACAACHGETAWTDQVRFDHDMSGFPLLGLHVGAPCEACHMTAAYKDAGVGCTDCHLAEDAHKGALGPSCANCHNPNGWAFWRFDHGAETDFALQGGHENLACDACHRPGTEPQKLADACISCHAGDDIHNGRFGARCERCHGVDNFKKVRIKR